jgi:hypothetical protein
MGNPFVPDEIEAAAKKLPALVAQAERILNLTEAVLTKVNTGIDDGLLDVAKLRAALKDAL